MNLQKISPLKFHRISPLKYVSSPLKIAILTKIHCSSFTERKVNSIYIQNKITRRQWENAQWKKKWMTCRRWKVRTIQIFYSVISAENLFVFQHWETVPLFRRIKKERTMPLYCVGVSNTHNKCISWVKKMLSLEYRPLEVGIKKIENTQISRTILYTLTTYSSSLMICSFFTNQKIWIVLVLCLFYNPRIGMYREFAFLKKTNWIVLRFTFFQFKEFEVYWGAVFFTNWRWVLMERLFFWSIIFWSAL